MELTNRISDRAAAVTVANLEHLATTGIGLAIAWLGARQRSFLGALIAASGIAIVVRGVSGMVRSLGREPNQGEGDTTAARRYNAGARAFVADDRVGQAATDAATQTRSS